MAQRGVGSGVQSGTMSMSSGKKEIRPTMVAPVTSHMEGGGRFPVGRDNMVSSSNDKDIRLARESHKFKGRSRRASPVA